MIDFWTDGSGIWDEKSLQPTGYAFVAQVDGGYVLEVAGWSPAGTNNTAELSAAIMALQSLNPSLRVGAHEIRVHADSEYVINQALKNHKTKANFELVSTLQGLQDYWKAQWIHVKGHSGNWGNERADVLAGAARRSSPRATAYFSHVRLYHRSSPDVVLLDQEAKRVLDFIGVEGEPCVARLLI